MASDETRPTEENKGVIADGIAAAVNAATAFNSFAETVRGIEELLNARRQRFGWGLLVNPEDKGYSSDRPDPYEQS